MFSITASGSFQNLESLLKKAQKMNVRAILETYGQAGVRALSSATPEDSGLASNSWYYEVTRIRGGYSITWSNSDIESGFPVAVMIQYGHATGTGGWVQGRDYINPALRPIFDNIADKAWKEVTSI
jgi:hypothetical protein